AARSFSGEGPMFWFTVGGDDPLYAVYIPESVVGGEDNWGGVHLMAPNYIFAYCPFPFSLFVHDGMPYAVSKVRECGLELGSFQLYNRCNAPASIQQCSDPSSLYSWVGALGNFDAATRHMSHEYVEAVTDPFPPFGWGDPGSGSDFAKEGEAADICRET